MKRTVAVVSDIHANHIALENALHTIGKLHPDNVLFLGDYVTDCPYPQKTMKLLYEAKETFSCGFLRGNREDYLLAHRENPGDGWEESSATGSLLYTYRNLTDRDLDFFASMPICADYTFTGCPTFTACHGSPVRTKDWIINMPAVLHKHMRSVRGKLLLCGHTHTVKIEEYCGKTAVFCPSVGISHDTNNDSGITLLTCEDGIWRYDFLPVPYDVEALVREFSESDLLDVGKIWALCIIGDLRMHRGYADECIRRAWRIAKERGFDGSSLPEEFYTAAAHELGLL